MNQLLFHVQEGMTPLLFAAEEGHANVVELLLTHKAGCNVKANVSLIFGN